LIARHLEAWEAPGLLPKSQSPGTKTIQYLPIEPVPMTGIEKSLLEIVKSSLNQPAPLSMKPVMRILRRPQGHTDENSPRCSDSVPGNRRRIVRLDNDGV